MPEADELIFCGPWNKGRLVGQKRPLKSRDVWTMLETTVRYLDVDVEDALSLSKQLEL